MQHTRILAALPLTILCAAPCASQSRDAVIAIERVTVVDVEAGRLLPGQSVLVRAGRIEAVAPSAEMVVPGDAQRVDARGLFVIPGLWDMHAHVPQNDTLRRMYLEFGVTGVREMGTAYDRVLRRRAEIAAGQWTGPRVVSSVFYIDGPAGYRQEGATLNPETPEQAIAAVDSIAGLGADFIKVLGELPRAAFLAVGEAARARGMRVAGHWPAEATLEDVLQTDPVSIEHLFRVSTACAFEGQERCARLSGVLEPDRVANIGAELARAGIWMTPTLVNQRRRAWRGDSAFHSDPRVALIPAQIAERWLQDSTLHRPFPPVVRSAYDREVATIPALRRAGVGFLAGTDGPGEYLFPGSSLHDELVLLVDAGLTAADALRAATLNAALALGMTDDAGTVQAGRRADLVLLGGDPLADITNVRRVRGVIFDGRWVRRL